MTPEESFASLPEDDKVKVFLVSLLGVIEAPDPADSSKKYALHFHHPELIEAASLEMAQGIACEKLDAMYPKGKGWLKRHATIDLIPSKSLARLAQLWELRFIAKNVEALHKPVEIDCDSENASKSTSERDTIADVQHDVPPA